LNVLWAYGARELLKIVADLDPRRSRLHMDMEGGSNLRILVERSTSQKKDLRCLLRGGIERRTAS
jgi:hypothetical protein